MVKKIFNVFTSVLLVILIVIVIFVFSARIRNESPSLFGYHIFQVTTGSMEPELMIGDVILDKEVEPNEIKVGDIITYKGTKGDLANKIITHKVKEVITDSSGNFHFITQGTAQGVIQDPEITQSQVIAKFQTKIPLLNGLYSFFLSEYGLIVFVGIIIALFAYELLSIIFSYKSIQVDEDVLTDNNNYNERTMKNDNEIYDDYKSLDEIQNFDDTNNDNN